MHSSNVNDGSPDSRHRSPQSAALDRIGFIPLGLLDSSVIPLPGSMDVLTLVLSARKQELCVATP
jgi:hypothetical protein